MNGHGARWAGLILLVLAAALLAELNFTNGPTETVGETADAGPTATGEGTPSLVPVFTLPEPEALESLAERPLFVASRRPPEPVTEEKVVKKPKPKPARRQEFILSAIVRDGNRWIAVLGTQGRGSPPPVEVEVGSQVAGWEVERIEAGGIVLRKGAQRTELTLRAY
jgi:hypothetical protein